MALRNRGRGAVLHNFRSVVLSGNCLEIEIDARSILWKRLCDQSIAVIQVDAILDGCRSCGSVAHVSVFGGGSTPPSMGAPFLSFGQNVNT